MVRTPSVAGSFYEADAERLKQQLKASFLHQFGPGALPSAVDKQKRDIVACVSPHAGYMFSGMCAAHVYYELSRQKTPKTIVVMGFNHRGLGAPFSVSAEDWATPLGVARTDRESISNLNIELDEFSHSNEHSIEVQLPFLQFIYGSINFIPINISSHVLRGGIGIEERIASLEDVLVIASSDFTHYGLNYGYIPFRDNVRERLKDLDMGAIQFIEKMDSAGFADYVHSTGATICGHAPIISTIETAKMLGAKKGELLKYSTSGDISGDYSSAVSYAAIVFRK